MSKMPIRWHEECLYNQMESLKREIEKRDRLNALIEKSQWEINFYGNQIACAKREKRDGFDSDLFMKKRKEATDER